MYFTILYIHIFLHKNSNKSYLYNINYIMLFIIVEKLTLHN